MGGRGTFTAGKPTEYMYETVDIIEGIKVLEGKGNLHHLPEESHTSSAYIRYYPGIKKFRELRIYDDEHYLVTEVAYHGEAKLNNGDGKTPILHYHIYTRDFGRKAYLLTKDHPLYKKYRKCFVGIPV